MATQPLKPETARFAPRLIVQTGPNAGREFVLVKDVVLLGRSDQCYIVIGDPLVSRRHSQITCDGAYCTIEDLSSTNGTFVNDERLDQPRVLHSGDQIRVADSVLVFDDPQATLTGLKLPTLLLEPPHRVYLNRQAVELSGKEFALLAFLHDHADQICSKPDIAAAVWPDVEVFDFQIEGLIKRLRQKIETNPDDPKLIVTLRGRGYRLIKE
jgi:hypothetical protein